MSESPCAWEFQLDFRLPGDYTARVRLVELHGTRVDPEHDEGRVVEGSSARIFPVEFNSSLCCTETGFKWEGTTMRLHSSSYLNERTCCALCTRTKECVAFNSIAYFFGDCSKAVANYSKRVERGGCELFSAVHSTMPTKVMEPGAHCFYAGVSRAKGVVTSGSPPGQSKLFPLHLTCNLQAGFRFVDGEAAACTCSDWMASDRKRLAAMGPIPYDCLQEDHLAVASFSVPSLPANTVLVRHRVGNYDINVGEASAAGGLPEAGLPSCAGNLNKLMQGRWHKLATASPSEGLQWESDFHTCARYRLDTNVLPFAVEGEGVCALRYEDVLGNRILDHGIRIGLIKELCVVFFNRAARVLG